MVAEKTVPPHDGRGFRGLGIAWVALSLAGEEVSIALGTDDDDYGDCTIGWLLGETLRE